MTGNTPLSCLLCQVKVAPNHYEREELLELIEDLSSLLKEMDEYEYRKYVDVPDTIEDGKEVWGQ